MRYFRSKKQLRFGDIFLILGWFCNISTLKITQNLSQFCKTGVASTQYTFPVWNTSESFPKKLFFKLFLSYVRIYWRLCLVFIVSGSPKYPRSPKCHRTLKWMWYSPNLLMSFRVYNWISNKIVSSDVLWRFFAFS